MTTTHPDALTPQEARTLARELMAHHGLDGWTVVLDNAWMRAGQCNQNKRQISLSRNLVAHRSEYETRMTILHEIAHALVGNIHRHNNVWRAKCIAIGGDGKSQAEVNAVVLADAAPYEVRCDGHNEVIGYAFRSNYKVANKVCRTHKTNISLVDSTTGRKVK